MADPQHEDNSQEIANTAETAKRLNRSRNTFLAEWQDGVWPDPVIIRGRRHWIIGELRQRLAKMPRDTGKKSA